MGNAPCIPHKRTSLTLRGLGDEAAKLIGVLAGAGSVLRHRSGSADPDQCRNTEKPKDARPFSGRLHNRASTQF